jgi:hypothetical protein
MTDTFAVAAQRRRKTDGDTQMALHRRTVPLPTSKLGGAVGAMHLTIW